METFKMSNILRTILHYQDATSDKVYIVEVNKLTGAKPYIVMTTWGKRSAPRLSSQIKAEFTSEYQAIGEARKLVDNKMRGKSAYKVAARGLTIAGLTIHQQTNVGDVISAGKTAAPKKVEVELITHAQDLKRNIRI